MVKTTQRTAVPSVAAIILAVGLAGTAMGQVTWQHHDVFTVPTFEGNDGSCWPSYNYCWQGSGVCCLPEVQAGSPQWLGFDGLDRPILAAQMPYQLMISFVATPTGPNSWSVYNSGLGAPVFPAHYGRIGTTGLAVDLTGQAYGVTIQKSETFFEQLSFFFHASPSNALIHEVPINHYQNSIKPQSAVVRPNRDAPGAHWLAATTIDFSGSTCEQGRLYFDGTRIDYPVFSEGNRGRVVSYDMDMGPDGQGNVVAEFIDTNCFPEHEPSGLFFWRTSAPAWVQIAPMDGGERGVKVAVDGLGVIHAFGARYSQGSGAGGPILHWTSADNGVTWSSVPEQVIPYLTFRDLYAVGVSNTGTVGVAYWTSPAMQELRFVEKRCGTWTEYANLGTAGTGASTIKVAYDSQDRPHIAYFEKPASPTRGTFKVAYATTALTATLTGSSPATICPATPLSSSVQTTGGGVITYQWQARLANTPYFDLAEGSNPWNNGSGGAFNAAGVNAATVTISGMADAPEDYPFSAAVGLRCVVSNACESATSDILVTTVCPADFDCNGFVTGEDFDAFVAAFELGDAAADYNLDGFVTGEDFDAFVAAFELGC